MKTATLSASTPTRTTLPGQRARALAWTALLVAGLALGPAGCGEGVDRPAPGTGSVSGPRGAADDPAASDDPADPTENPGRPSGPTEDPGQPTQDKAQPRARACDSFADEQSCEAANCHWRLCPPTALCKVAGWCEEGPACAPLPGGEEATCTFSSECPTNYDQTYVCENNCCVPARPSQCESYSERDACEAAGCTFRECPPNADCAVAGWCQPRGTCQAGPDGRELMCTIDLECPRDFGLTFFCVDGCCVPEEDPSSCESQTTERGCSALRCHWEPCPPNALCQFDGFCQAPGTGCEELDEAACEARPDCRAQFVEICDCTCNGERGCAGCPEACFPFAGCTANF